MNLDLSPIFQDVSGLKSYLQTNFRRIQDLFTSLRKQPALPNTTGATLAQLETEVNAIKARMRSFGVMD